MGNETADAAARKVTWIRDSTATWEVSSYIRYSILSH